MLGVPLGNHSKITISIMFVENIRLQTFLLLDNLPKFGVNFKVCSCASALLLIQEKSAEAQQRTFG
jgi:hypothetical protein